MQTLFLSFNYCFISQIINFFIVLEQATKIRQFLLWICDNDSELVLFFLIMNIN